MGMSASSYICFGIDLGMDEPEFLEPFEGEWDKFVANLCGTPPPAGPYESNKKEHQAYWETCRKLEQEYPLDLIRYSSGDDPMFFLGVRFKKEYLGAAAVNGDWEGPTTFDPSALVVMDDQLTAFTEFCKKHGIEGEPKWTLLSYWS